jgi:hypothetical protein
MVNTYQLVNPHIEGKFNSKIKARNSSEAANLFYKNLSEHFNNSVPKFHFTIQKGSSGEGKYYHFEVKEMREDNAVTFDVKQINVQGESEALDRFKTKLENFKSKFNQDGGKKKSSKSKKHSKDDSDSDSLFDSSEDFYRRAKSYLPVTQPIYYWWYDPYLYRMDSIYIPTFYSYVTPYIELSLKL